MLSDVLKRVTASPGSTVAPKPETFLRCCTERCFRISRCGVIPALQDCDTTDFEPRNGASGGFAVCGYCDAGVRQAEFQALLS
jgi:hypothetical protein